MILRKWLTFTLGDERGSILLAGLMAVFVATVLGLALYDLAVVDNRLVLGDDCGARSLYAAEAGLQVAYRDLANGTTIGSVDFDGVVGSSTYASRTTLTGYSNRTLSGSNAPPTTYAVQAQGVGGNTITLWSTGTATSNCPGGPSSTTVRAQVTKITAPGGPGHSFVGLDEITTGGSGFLLDSFDSSKGPYNCVGGTAGCTVPNGTNNLCQQTTAPFTCNVSLWTNGPARTTLDGGPIYGSITSASGEIKLKSANTIYGTLTYDTTDGTFTGSASQVKGGVTGQGSPGIGPITLPAVQDCRTMAGGGFSSASYVSARITAGTYTYDATAGTFIATSNLTMNPGASPANFCFSNFSMGGRDLTIPATVAHEIVINIGSATDNSTIGQALLNGNIVNSTGQSQYLRVFSISNKGNDDVWITTGTGSYVFAYAPNGQVQVKSGGSFFGAAFGKQLEANGGSKLHFDKALLSVPGLPGLTTGGGGGTITYSLQSWTQCRNSACT